jgi:hypothetical protein
MTRLRTCVLDYLKMRRSLGFKLYDAGIGLLDFVAFMERKHAPRITTKLALEWAQKPKTVLPPEWARRLSLVRGFARYLSAIDPRTEIPPAASLPYRPQRARPYRGMTLEAAFWSENQGFSVERWGRKSTCLFPAGSPP